MLGRWRGYKDVAPTALTFDCGFSAQLAGVSERPDQAIAKVNSRITSAHVLWLLPAGRGQRLIRKPAAFASVLVLGGDEISGVRGAFGVREGSRFHQRVGNRRNHDLGHLRPRGN